MGRRKKQKTWDEIQPKVAHIDESHQRLLKLCLEAMSNNICMEITYEVAGYYILDPEGDKYNQDALIQEFLTERIESVIFYAH